MKGGLGRLPWTCGDYLSDQCLCLYYAVGELEHDVTLWRREKDGRDVRRRSRYAVEPVEVRPDCIVVPCLPSNLCSGHC